MHTFFPIPNLITTISSTTFSLTDPLPQLLERKRESLVMERGWKPNVEIAPNCPRCGSCNTKFCYYNNYSLTQPRYFCKGCRRYWTKGGSLRNVPVGGGCRKSRRSGKSIRVSTNRISGGPGHTGNLMVESTSSSNIDIAQVYANFLNQPPKPNTQLEMDELPMNDDLSFHFSNVSNSCLDFNSHLPLENGFVEGGNISDRSSETHQSDGGSMYLCGFDSIHKQQEGFTADDHHMIISNYGLPPLPGDMGYWSSSQMMVTNHILQISQLPRIETEETQHPDQLIVNKSSFDLSSYGSFFRP